MSNDKQMIRFFSFSQFHNKIPPTGSTKIRVNQLIKYWDGADLYKYGENPDVLIFQKVYCTQDYKYPAHFEGLKILDVCDPDWLDNMPIKETVDAVDAITCSSQPLVDFIKQLTDKPVLLIPDRFDLEEIPPPKKHTGDAKRVVWFGYRHNHTPLKSALPHIEKHGLELLVISDDNPILEQYRPTMKSKLVYKKYQDETIYKLLQTADYAVLPLGVRPHDKFKSNNRTVKAILAGLPVATTVEDLSEFKTADNRNKYIAREYDKIKHEYDVKKSVEQYKELIDGLRSRNNKN